MADKKEYIERGAFMQELNDTQMEFDHNYRGLGRAKLLLSRQPAADVVSLDDVREAFQAYILEMTCSKYGTPEETQFARDIVSQAVDIVLGERKDKP